LHYFIPELEDEPGSDALADASEPRLTSNARRPTAASASESSVPILGVPIGDRDVVRAALTWNLAVEIARLGLRALILAPASKTTTPLWPAAGVGPLGTELRFCPAQNLAELSTAAVKFSAEFSTTEPRDPGVLFVRVPPEWLIEQSSTPLPLAWWLLLSSPNHSDLAEAHEFAAAIGRVSPSSKVGVTIHGVSTIDDAKRAYEHLLRLCITQDDRDLLSYGLLVDDLHVYRAIAAQRPIGLAHPQAPATRALMDVARLLAEDARSFADE